MGPPCAGDRRASSEDRHGAAASGGGEGRTTRRGRPQKGRPRREWFPRRPTLPPGYPGSTIGAGGLNFRVRNVTGCVPSATTTGDRRGTLCGSCPLGTGPFSTRRACERAEDLRTPRVRSYPPPFRGDPRNFRASASARRQALGLLVPVSSTCCHASTSGLSTQSSSWGPYLLEGVGDLISRWASRLDAFSAYPFRT